MHPVPGERGAADGLALRRSRTRGAGRSGREPPPCRSTVGPNRAIAMAEHSRCQPGRPGPNGDAHDGSSASDGCQSTKSSGSRWRRSSGRAAPFAGQLDHPLAAVAGQRAVAGRGGDVEVGDAVDGVGVTRRRPAPSIRSRMSSIDSVALGSCDRRPGVERGHVGVEPGDLLGGELEEVDAELPRLRQDRVVDVGDVAHHVDRVAEVLEAADEDVVGEVGGGVAEVGGVVGRDAADVDADVSAGSNGTTGTPAGVVQPHGTMVLGRALGAPGPGGRAVSSGATMGQAGLMTAFAIAKDVKAEIKDDNLVVASAGVAFFALLSIVPALMALVSIYGLVADPDDVRTQIDDLLESAPREVRDFFSSQLADLAAGSSGGLGLSAVIGIVIALWGASGAIKHLIAALNAVEDVHETRNVVAPAGHLLPVDGRRHRRGGPGHRPHGGPARRAGRLWAGERRAGGRRHRPVPPARPGDGAQPGGAVPLRAGPAAGRAVPSLPARCARRRRVVDRAHRPVLPVHGERGSPQPDLRGHRGPRRAAPVAAAHGVLRDGRRRGGGRPPAPEDRGHARPRPPEVP